MSRGGGRYARGMGCAGRAGRGTPWTLGMSRRLVVSFTSALFSAQLAPRREAVLVTASCRGRRAPPEGKANRRRETDRERTWERPRGRARGRDSSGSHVSRRRRRRSRDRAASRRGQLWCARRALRKLVSAADARVVVGGRCRETARFITVTEQAELSSTPNFVISSVKHSCSLFSASCTVRHDYACPAPRHRRGRALQGRRSLPVAHPSTTFGRRMMR